MFLRREKLQGIPHDLFAIYPLRKRPHYLVYKDGSVAFGGQCFGFKGGVLQAVTVAKFTLQPVVERPRAKLDGTKTPPTPSPGSDDDHDPDHEYEHGNVTQSYTYKVVVQKSLLQVVRSSVPPSIPQHDVHTEPLSPQRTSATAPGGATNAKNFYAVRIRRKPGIFST